jgi:hypothetical protein
VVTVDTLRVPELRSMDDDLSDGVSLGNTKIVQ